MLSLVLIFMIAVFTSVCAVHNLPSYLPKCCIDDPEFNACFLNATKTLRPYIRKGIKEIGIPSYKPNAISSLEVKQESESVEYTVNIKNFSIRGLDDYNFTNFQYDPNSNMKFSGEINFHPLFLNMLYVVNGSLLSIPIEGKGQAHVSIGPINSTFELTGNMTKLNDKEYYDPTEIKFVFTADDMNLYLEGLFGENNELASATNKLLNQNSKPIVNALTPAMEAITESFLARYVKWLFKAFPFEELFPNCSK